MRDTPDCPPAESPDAMRTRVLDSACGHATFILMPPEAAVLTASYTMNLLAPAAVYDRPGVQH